VTRGGPIARRYARALFSIGQESRNVRQILEEVDTLTEEIFQSEDLRRVLLAPIHPRAERKGVLAAVGERLGISSEVCALAALLVEENRSGLLPAIRDALRDAVDAAEGKVVAEVRTARPLEPGQIDQLQRALSRRVGAEVTMSIEIDEGILGGVVARVGDLLLDGSVRTQLASLAGSLRRGSS
jgi:F-type H+-transporting ATPase subunit delta